MSRPRRDPRAEAARRAVPGGARPRSTIEAAVVVAASGRPRRDPRAEIAALLVPAPRRRIDRLLAAAGGAAAASFAGRGASATDAVAAATAAAPSVRIVDVPAFHVLVVPDAAAGRAGAHDRQLLGAARLLADAGGGAVVLVADGGEWGTLGADRVVSLSQNEADALAAHTTQPSPPAGEGREGGSGRRDTEIGAPPLPALPLKGGGAPQAADGTRRGNDTPSITDSSAPAVPSAYDPAPRADAIVAIVRALAPRHVLFAETADGGDLARRVAALLGEPLFAGAESITARAVTRQAKAGRVEQRAAPPRLVSVLADVVAAHAGTPHEGRRATLADLTAELPSPPVAGAPPAAGSASGIVSAETIAADPAVVPLSEASFVVSAGNGVTDFAAYRSLVAELGATPGASRVVCDAGLMPRDRQVGASGTVLDATCYFALGIAGAPQHLQGVAKCEHVVAVNTDLHAAMIERAGLAVVADAQTVMPALAALLATERGGVSATTGAVAIPPGADPDGGETRRRADQAAAWPGADTLDVTDPNPLRARVLLSAGRHQVSGRLAPVRAEAQATALALALGADVRGLHAGGDGAAVTDHLGHGLDAIEVAAGPGEGDPLPALVAALSRGATDLVLTGRRGIGGDDTGLLPYRLAAALGLPLIADAVALARDPGAPGVLVVDQALPRGARRRVRVRLPAVVTVHPAAPPPRPFAFAAVRRGHLVPLVMEAGAGGPPLAIEERPWRRRPRLIAGTATSGSAADRLKAATEVAGGGGRLLVNPDPDEAAREILAYLRGIGVVAPGAG